MGAFTSMHPKEWPMLQSRSLLAGTRRFSSYLLAFTSWRTGGTLY
jgi:hypothetical protein